MIVREATVDDARAIAVVQVDGWRAAYAEILPAAFLADLSVESREQAWRGFMGTPRGGARFFVAETSGVVGFASIGPSRDDDANGTGELYALYASPTRWGAGVGRALMERASEALRVFGAASLWVLAENLRARRFYELAGWSPDGATKNEELGGRTITEVRYRRTLAS